MQMKSIWLFAFTIFFSNSLRVSHVGKCISVCFTNGCLEVCTSISNQSFFDTAKGLAFTNCCSKNPVHTYLCPCLYMLAEEILGVELLCQRICVFLILIDASFKLGYTTITNSFSLKQQRFISSSLAIVD